MAETFDEGQKPKQPGSINGEGLTLAGFNQGDPKTVYLDIGHCTSGERNPLLGSRAGTDQGFQGPGYTECQINQGVGKELIKDLTQAGFYVVPTWDPAHPPEVVPKQEDLQRRVDKVNNDVDKYGGDSIYLSIHHDSDTSGKSGQCVFVADNKMREGITLARAIQSTAWNVRERQGTESCINSDLVTGNGKLVGLRGVKVPGVLVEAANVMNPRDRALMPDPVFQRQEAAAITRGVVKYFQLQPGTQRPLSSVVMEDLRRRQQGL